MTDSQWHFQDLLEIGRRIQSRELSAEEVTKAMLKRIAAVDPALHSYVTVMADEAVTDAGNADREIAAGKARGPLHGVPVAVKDLLWTAGTATTHGMPLNRAFVPDQDATTVRRLRDAGAVILGKLQQTKGAFSSHHPDIRPPVNPWGPELWPGVSSSGSGVATATGLCFGSLGTDTGGSIRFPSAANGVTGLKPTWGRVSRYGAFELAASLDHIGPIARTAADTAAILGAIAGPDRNDPTASQQPVPDYLALMTRGLSGLRLGLDRAWALENVDGATQRVMSDALAVLGDLGAEVREITFPATEQVAADWQALCGVEAAYAHRETYPQRASAYGPELAALIELGRSLSPLEYQALIRRRAGFAGEVHALFETVDLVLAPVTPFAGITIRGMAEIRQDPQRGVGRLRYTAPLDMSGHPTITLPGGFTDTGAPVAFQLIAGHFREELLIRGGWAYQRATDWHRRHPEVAARP